MITYDYSAENLLDNPQGYHYSEFHGVDFLNEYLTYREGILLKINAPDELSFDADSVLYGFINEMTVSTYNKSNSLINTVYLLKNFLMKNSHEDFEYLFGRLLQKFEVSKKLNDQYAADNLMPIGNNRNLLVYILFGMVLIDFYSKTKNLKYLNALLKVTDILCSVAPISSIKYSQGIGYIIRKEIHFIDRLLNKCEIML